MRFNLRRLIHGTLKRYYYRTSGLLQTSLIAFQPFIYKFIIEIHDFLLCKYDNFSCICLSRSKMYQWTTQIEICLHTHYQEHESAPSSQFRQTEKYLSNREFLPRQRNLETFHRRFNQTRIPRQQSFSIITMLIFRYQANRVGHKHVSAAAYPQRSQIYRDLQTALSEDLAPYNIYFFLQETSI